MWLPWNIRDITLGLITCHPQPCMLSIISQVAVFFSSAMSLQAS